VGVGIERFYLFFAICLLVVAALVFLSGAPVYVALGWGGGSGRWHVRLVALVGCLLPRPPGEDLPQRIPQLARRLSARSESRACRFNDRVRLIANESAEPVRGEFRHIVESQQVGPFHSRGQYALGRNHAPATRRASSAL
jgi:tight adherence protein B